MKKIVSVCIVLVLMFAVFTTASAKRYGVTASIKGPDQISLGKIYRYTVACTGGDTMYVEVGDLPRIVAPKIISGEGILHYVPDRFPAWFGWVGEPTANFKATFFVKPESVGTYRMWLSCWGSTMYDATYIDVKVTKNKR